MSSDRVRPRVSCCSRTVRNNPSRPFGSKNWMGARLRGPHPPPLPRERTKSRNSYTKISGVFIVDTTEKHALRFSSFLLSSSMCVQPLRLHMFPDNSNTPERPPPSRTSNPSKALPAYKTENSSEHPLQQSNDAFSNVLMGLAHC